MSKSDRIVAIIIGVFLIIIFVALYTSIKSGGRRYISNHGKGHVAVVEVKGMIVNPLKVVDKLRKYSDREDIKAIVLRIDSPGGGVAASQEIYEAVKRVRNTGKPVVASMASVAASGGYYVALGASKIIANPGSITGSIGVIVSFPLVVELMDKIGAKIETVKSGDFKDTGSPYREITDKEREYLDKVVADLYNQFVEDVSRERNIDKKELLKLADGRIFTGAQAFNYGLIDTLGTFEDAILIAGELVGIKGRPKVVFERKKKITLFDILFGDAEAVLSLFRERMPRIEYRMW